MKFNFTFKHMDTSESLQNYAKEKIGVKIKKFVNKAVEAHVLFSVNKHDHKIVLSFHGGDGFHVEVEHTSTDMYEAVDLMIPKLESQLRKKKEKLKNHKNKGRSNMKLVPDEAEMSSIDAEDIIKYEQQKRVNC